MRIQPLMAAALAGSLVLSACGGDGDGNDGGGLAPLFGNPEEFAAEEIQVQEKIRDCMAALGFPYVPVDPNARGRGSQMVWLSSDEFVKEYGYGISTSVDRPLFEVSDAPMSSDPNQKYTQSLSEADRAAYQEALYGRASAFDGGTTATSDGGAVFTLGEGGCLGEANKAVRGDRGRITPEIAQGLQEVARKVAADQRVVKAYQKWSACMRESGFDFVDDAAARASIAARTKAITGRETMASIGGGAIVIAGAIGSSASQGGADAPPDYDVAALKALQEEERKVASASLACREKHVDSIEQKVRREYEDAFIRDNPDLAPKKGG